MPHRHLLSGGSPRPKHSAPRFVWELGPRGSTQLDLPLEVMAVGGGLDQAAGVPGGRGNGVPPSAGTPNQARRPQLSKPVISDSDTDGKILPRAVAVCLALGLQWDSRQTAGAGTTGPSVQDTNPASGHFLKRREVWGPVEEAGVPGGTWGAWGGGILPTRPPPLTRMEIVRSFVTFEPTVSPAQSLLQVRGLLLREGQSTSKDAR